MWDAWHRGGQGNQKVQEVDMEEGGSNPIRKARDSPVEEGSGVNRRAGRNVSLHRLTCFQVLSPVSTSLLADRDGV